HLEEERQDVAIGGLGRVEHDLHGLRVPGVVPIGRVVVVSAGVADPRVEHARLAADQILQTPETAAGQDGGLRPGIARDLSAVMDSAGHDAFSSSVISNCDRNCPYPSASSCAAGTKRSDAEFMQ